MRFLERMLIKNLRNTTQKGKSSIVYSFKRNQMETTERLICLYANINPGKEKNFYSMEETVKLHLAGEELKHSNIYIGDTFKDAGDIELKVEEWKNEIPDIGFIALEGLKISRKNLKKLKKQAQTPIFIF